MAKQYKYTEWADTNYWYCNCADAIGKVGAQWWFPARFLNMSVPAYVEMVITQYKPDKVHFNGSLLFLAWKKENYAAMHRFVLFINREAKKRGITV